jgi:alanyl-tRNA synthetase
MTSREIRSAFLRFFEERGHVVVPSSSLVPDEDPTLLFVNAGMVQFKNVFLGVEKRPYNRATSCQKCVRAGGKHNDLENIGRTQRHHTFFEMLGNFSFGDYFKEEAISFAFEFVRHVLSLDLSRMWITVFEEDEEAERIWKKMGIKADRILRFGEKDNFWAMGDFGPCGPCSEIVYDLGEDVGCGRPSCKVGCDCDRFLEIWNLVFMEFERTKEGQIKRLPRPSIDTGMGLERITTIMEGKKSNYETDLFLPLLREIERLSGRAYGEHEETDVAMRVVADHTRGASFIINDGVLPSKEQRGYVLRRIIRRSLRYGRKLGIKGPFLYRLSSVVCDLLEDVYPELKQNHAFIAGVIKAEEERFGETLEAGMSLYERVIEGIRGKGERVIPGGLVYRLYDTYGFPIDLQEEMAREDGLVLDVQGFERELSKQKERSRAALKMKGGISPAGAAPLDTVRTSFTGYTDFESEAEILFISKDGEASSELSAGEEGILFFSKTPFYAEQGGQTSDRGVVRSQFGEGVVKEVRRIREDLFLHLVQVHKGTLRKGDHVLLIVDKERRLDVSRNHTATHLLHFALRQILGKHVKQAGSSVEDTRLRFDFTHPSALTEGEIRAIEDLVNEKIMECHPVIVEEKLREEAVREGAIALFEERYGERVRVVGIGDFSKELCGGTHVRNTGQIGCFWIVEEGSLAYGVRRMVAVTGRYAIRRARKMGDDLREMAQLLNVDVERLKERVAGLKEELDRKTEALLDLKMKLLRVEVEAALRRSFTKDGTKVVALYLDGLSLEELRRVADMARELERNVIVLLASEEERKAKVVLALGHGVKDRYHAGNMLRGLLERYGGKGGGGPTLAQGGVPSDRVAQVLEGIKEMV